MVVKGSLEHNEHLVTLVSTKTRPVVSVSVEYVKKKLHQVRGTQAVIRFLLAKGKTPTEIFAHIKTI